MRTALASTIAAELRGSDHVLVPEVEIRWSIPARIDALLVRSSADAREAYAAAKHGAAKVWGNDRAAYTEAKSDVVLGILDRAEAWPPPPAGQSGISSPLLAAGPR